MPISKPDSCSFLFSVNEDCKYPISGRDREAIVCNSNYCAPFGKDGRDLEIRSETNNKDFGRCLANMPSFNLPPAQGYASEKGSSSINGGKINFRSKEFEVFQVFVSIIFI